MYTADPAKVQEGSNHFWPAVKYLHGQPDTGLVVVRNLLEADQVNAVNQAAEEDHEFLADQGFGSMPNVVAVRRALELSLVANGIMLSVLTTMNLLKWDEKSDLQIRADEFQVTNRGKSILPHVDNFSSPPLRPVGVGLSISMGSCEFGASLPPVELRTKSGDPTGELYKAYKVPKPRQITHSAELGPGDAALWLQPGAHAAIVEDRLRFASLYLTLEHMG